MISVRLFSLFLIVVWVNNDKKEKELSVGKNSLGNDDNLDFWKFADNRISDVDVRGKPKKDENKPSHPLFVGTEDTPTIRDKHRHGESVQNMDTVDAEYIGDEDSHEDSPEDDSPEEDSPEGDSQQFQREGHGSQVDTQNVDEFGEVHNQESEGNSQSLEGDSNGIEGQSQVLNAHTRRVHDVSQGIDNNSPGLEDNSHDVEGLSQTITVEDGSNFRSNTNNEESQEVMSEHGPIEETMVNEVGQGKSQVTRSKKHKHKKKKKQGSKKEKLIALVVADEDGEVSVKGDTKATIQKHVESPDIVPGSDEIKKAKSMLYDGVIVKRDTFGAFEPEEFEEGTIREKMGTYAPDDNDISSIVSRFTDHRAENGHRMGNDELQMHLDDEALKMQVKAIEEEDSNVKNVLQGSEKFANEQKLGHLEGDFEKDLIQSFGKSGLDLEKDDLGKKRLSNAGKRDRGDRGKGKFDSKEGDGGDMEREDRERNGGEKENFKGEENENDQDDEGDDESERGSSEERSSDEKHWSDDDDDKKMEDETGDRKDIVQRNPEVKSSSKNSKRRSKKYNFYGPTGKLAISQSDEADMGVNIDNQAMESEIKAIESEDVKVGKALEEQGKDSQKIDLEEYKYETPVVTFGKKHHQNLDSNSGNGESGFGEYKTKMADQKQDISPVDGSGLQGTKASGDIKEGGSPNDGSGVQDTQLSDEIRAMLRETSKVLNETNSVLNEGHEVTHKTKQVLDSMLHKNKDSGSDVRTVSNETNATQNETSVAQNMTNVVTDRASSASNENNTLNGNSTVDNGNSTAENKSSTIENGNDTTDKKNTTIDQANNNATINNQTNSTNNVSRSENSTDTENSVITDAADEFKGKAAQQAPAKRELGKGDDYELKLIQQKLKRRARHEKAKQKSNHVVRRKKKRKHNFALYAQKKYTNSELKILNLMYKSPIFSSVKGNIAKFKIERAEKRSNIKTSFKRYKKQRRFAPRGRFTKRKQFEIGKKRGSVEEGMTGGKSHMIFYCPFQLRCHVKCP